MKTKITILLIALFVLAFSSQALAQTKDATITGAKTGTPVHPNWNAKVEYIDIQSSDDIIDADTPWNTVYQDFYILDHISGNYFVVDSVNTGDVVDDQYFRAFIDTSSWSYGPAEKLLKLKYTADTDSIKTENSTLQPTYTDIKISDGIVPTAEITSTTSNL